MSTTESRRSDRAKKLGLSLREVGRQSGVSFSTIARVHRGEGSYSPESDLKIRAWLGDDVSAERDAIRDKLLTAEARQKAEELGRVIAMTFSAEILKLLSTLERV